MVVCAWDDGPEPPYDWEGGDGPPGPDLLVEAIRDLVHTWVERGHLTEAQSADLVQCIDLLDDLLSAGNPLPQVWAKAGTLKVMALPPPRREHIVHPSPDYL